MARFLNDFSVLDILGWFFRIADITQSYWEDNQNAVFKA